jgi:hypothetical protein
VVGSPLRIAHQRPPAAQPSGSGLLQFAAAAAPPAAAAEELDLVYDPVLNCYYDPTTMKYYEII